MLGINQNPSVRRNLAFKNVILDKSLDAGEYKEIKTMIDAKMDDIVEISDQNYIDYDFKIISDDIKTHEPKDLLKITCYNRELTAPIYSSPAERFCMIKHKSRTSLLPKFRHSVSLYLDCVLNHPATIMYFVKHLAEKNEHGHVGRISFDEYN